MAGTVIGSRVFMARFSSSILNKDRLFMLFLCLRMGEGINMDRGAFSEGKSLLSICLNVHIGGTNNGIHHKKSCYGSDMKSCL